MKLLSREIKLDVKLILEGKIVLVTQGNKMVESVTLLKENQGFVPKTKNSRIANFVHLS